MATTPNPFEARPRTGVLYGVTHNLDTHEPITRLPRTVKVSIGLPAGKALHAAYNPTTKEEGRPWVVTVGERSNRFATMEEARRFYRQSKEGAPERRNPNKLDYFTFRRFGSDGTLEPDWKAIEAHGNLPRKLDIVFTDDEPLESSYKMWGAGRLKCWGDGVNALRSIEMAKTPAEMELVKQAKDLHLKSFPIAGGCHECGCPFGAGDKPECKPFGRLAFQLVHDIRLGGKAEIVTTAYQSLVYLSSSILELKRITGGGDSRKGFIAGIPLQLVLIPSKNKHGKVWYLGLEFHADSLGGLRKKLFAFGAEFRAQLAPPERMQIEGETVEILGEEAVSPEEAAAIEAEFIGGQADDGDEDFADPEAATAETPSEQAGAATATRTEELKGRLARQRKTAEAKPEQTAQEPAPQPAAAKPEQRAPGAAPQQEAASVPAEPEKQGAFF